MDPSTQSITVTFTYDGDNTVSYSYQTSTGRLMLFTSGNTVSLSSDTTFTITGMVSGETIDYVVKCSADGYNDNSYCGSIDAGLSVTITPTLTEEGTYEGQTITLSISASNTSGLDETAISVTVYCEDYISEEYEISPEKVTTTLESTAVFTVSFTEDWSGSGSSALLPFSYYATFYAICSTITSYAAYGYMGANTLVELEPGENSTGTIYLYRAPYWTENSGTSYYSDDTLTVHGNLAESSSSSPYSYQWTGIIYDPDSRFSKCYSPISVGDWISFSGDSTYGLDGFIVTSVPSFSTSTSGSLITVTMTIKGYNGSYSSDSEQYSGVPIYINNINGALMRIILQ